MDNSSLTELSKIIDKEIADYEDIRDLYSQKKQILIAHNMEELPKIDEKITIVIENLKKIKAEKNKILPKDGDNEYKISELISLSSESSSDLAGKFSVQRERIKKLADEIIVLEQTNRELIKQGLNFTKQMLNFISKDDAAGAGNYNNQGQISELTGYSSIEQNV